MNKITITCKNISRSFTQGKATTLALADINLEAHENELIMLMGPSGSGKTTLISIIGGLLKQTSAECLVLDKPINNLPEKEKTKFRGKSIGFLFQYFNLVPTLNSIENAAIPLLLNGYSREQAMQESSELLF